MIVGKRRNKIPANILKVIVKSDWRYVVQGRLLWNIGQINADEDALTVNIDIDKSSSAGNLCETE